MSGQAIGGPDKAAEGTSPKRAYPDGFFVEVSVERGKSTATGRDFTSIVMRTPRGNLQGLRVDEWSLIHDIMPEGNPIKAALGAAIVERIALGGGKQTEVVSKARVAL